MLKVILGFAPVLVALPLVLTGQAAPSTLFVGAHVVDGTGASARMAAVRISGDRITDVGAMAPREGEQVIDARGLILSPGFIDTHSHHDRGLLEDRSAPGAVSQGITTIVLGQDGGSAYPLSPAFARFGTAPPAVNVASYVGHGTLRRQVMQEDFKRAATRDEIGRMEQLLRQEMDAGALGLSTGLEYDPGIYSDPSEVVALAKVAASYGGRYISHIRSEDRAFWKAIDEAITVGREAEIPVQISHLKLAMRSLWGQTDRLLKTLNAARASGVEVTADVYPYTYWQSGMSVLFPDRDFTSRSEAEFALREVTSAEGVLITRFEPDGTYQGKTLAEIAKLRGVDPPRAMIDLLRESNGEVGIVATSMDEADVVALLEWPFANVCSDGTSTGGHPRGFGAFTRVLGRYVRERRALSLEEAVRKMTSLSAANVGLKERGTIEPGGYADLVLFDASAVIDHATTADPKALSSGIRGVWVNGVRVFDGRAATGRYPGLVLRRQ